MSTHHRGYAEGDLHPIDERKLNGGRNNPSSGEAKSFFSDNPATLRGLGSTVPAYRRSTAMPNPVVTSIEMQN